MPLLSTLGSASIQSYGAYSSDGYEANSLTEVTTSNVSNRNFTVPSSVNVGDLVIATTYIKGTWNYPTSSGSPLIQQTPTGYTQLVDGDGDSGSGGASSSTWVCHSTVLRIIESTSERSTAHNMINVSSGVNIQKQDTLLIALRPSKGTMTIHKIGDGDTSSGNSDSTNEDDLLLPTSATWPLSSASWSWSPSSSFISGRYEGLVIMKSFHEVGNRYPTHVLPATATSDVTNGSTSNSKMSALYRAYQAGSVSESYSFGNPSNYYGSNTNGSVGLGHYNILYR